MLFKSYKVNDWQLNLMQKKQNISHAVMSRRFEPIKSLDNFPTPPWATRALIEKVIRLEKVEELTCLEPACGAGHMSKVLTEYFKSVEASDVHDYGHGKKIDFLSDFYNKKSFDWVITNPPFKLAEEFILKSLEVSRFGSAFLVRTNFLESIGRYERLFSQFPPSCVAQFVERVPIVKGRLDKYATTATGYAWLIWKKDKAPVAPQLKWIEPCRRSLEKDIDYIETISSTY